MRKHVTIIFACTVLCSLFGCGEDKYKGMKVERTMGYGQAAGPTLGQQMVYGSNAVPNNDFDAMNLGTDLMTEEVRKLKILKGDIWIKFDLGRQALSSGTVPSDIPKLLSETGTMIMQLGSDKISILLKDIHTLYNKGYQAHMADEAARHSQGYKPSGKVEGQSVSVTPNLRGGQMDFSPSALDIGIKQLSNQVTNVSDFDKYVKSNHMLPAEAKWLAFNMAHKKLDQVGNLLGLSSNSAFHADPRIPDFSSMPSSPVIPSADPFTGE